MVLWIVHHVIYKLAGLRVLYRQVVPVYNRLHEELVDQLAISLPHLSIVRNEHMVSTCNQIVAHIAVWAVGIDGALFVNELLDIFAIS